MNSHYERHDDHHSGIAVQDSILIELRELRTDFNTHARSVGERLATLEGDLHAVIGNRQPGRLSVVESKLSDLQHWRWKMVGICTGLSSGAALLFHLWK